MTVKYHSQTKTAKKENLYSRFDQFNGQHPWMQKLPDGFVPYRVRELNHGKVTYFNYVLAKEMGLIPQNHPHEMTPALEEKLVKNFSIQIINEYDELNNKRIQPNTIKPNLYMATRYLQLQHANKKGKTSGDGRGIWNGLVQHNGLTWDVSSRGTGVTCLSPGAVQANRPLKTGGTDYGYGCGLAEMDELYGAALSAEIMHLQGINTERVLCIIDHGRGHGIGVRAAKNLIRPAHLFLYLKQNRKFELKKAIDYLIERQVQNKRWHISLKSNSKYQKMLDCVSRDFARFASTLDVDYIFAWLDWDGDNVLADAGIIDYGSIRQFGIRHDKYRYDDVERFSTNLNEQRKKAKLIVQVFAQCVDYIQSGKKKSLREFEKNKYVRQFESQFEKLKKDRLLYRIGFNEQQRIRILSNTHLYTNFEKEFHFFETAKISGKIEKVADGVNHPPLYNMRSGFRFLINKYIENKNSITEFVLYTNDLHKIMLSSFAKKTDLKLTKKHESHLIVFQNSFIQLLQCAFGYSQIDASLKAMSRRTLKLNTEKRITGNALIQLIDEIMDEQKNGLKDHHIQSIIDQFIFDHTGFPEVKVSRFYKNPPHTHQNQDVVYKKLIRLIVEHNEDI